MVDTRPKGCASSEKRARGRPELETQEVHRGGLDLVLALEVLVCHRAGYFIAHREETARLDALELRQGDGPLVRVGVLNEERGLQVGAIRDQWVVGIELVLD